MEKVSEDENCVVSVVEGIFRIFNFDRSQVAKIIKPGTARHSISDRNFIKTLTEILFALYQGLVNLHTKASDFDVEREEFLRNVFSIKSIFMTDYA